MRSFLLSSVAIVTATSSYAQSEFVDVGEIIVNTAQRDARELLDTPVAVTVVESEDLERWQATDYPQLIGDVPGLTIDGGPRGISQEPNIRGFQDEQIVLRFDGGRFNFNQAHRGRFFLDPEIIQRVEVVRGGGSTLFGSGAIGGVIAVETKDASDLLAPGQKFGTRLNFGYSSNGEIGTGGITLYGDNGTFDGLAYVGVRRQGADVTDGSGTDIRNSKLDSENAVVKFGYEPNAANRIELGYTWYQDEGTTPANSTSASGGLTDVDRDADGSQFRLGWTYQPENSDLFDLSALFYNNDLEIKEDRQSDGRADRTTYRTTGFELVNRSRIRSPRPTTFVYGLEVFRDTQSGTRDGGDRAQFPDAKADTIGIFGEATVSMTERLDIIAGLRYDNYKRDPDDPSLASASDDFFSPRLGFSYRPNDAWQIFGNVARAFRAPTLTELYNDGVHFATPGFPLGPGFTFTGVNNFVPNPDLEPEKSTQLDLGARMTRNDAFRPGDTFTFGVNVYYADVTDYIDQTVNFIDNSTIQPGPGGLLVSGTTTSSNVNARLWGLEANFTYDTGSWYTGGGLTVPRGEQRDGTPLGSIPQDRLNVVLGFRPNDAWDLGGRLTLAGSQNDVPEGSEPGEAYQVVDLFASWRVPVGRNDAIIRFGVDNVFDEFYTIYPNSLPQAGRTFKVSAGVAF